MNEPVLSRNLPLQESDQAAALAMLVYSLPRIQGQDAIAGLAGLGEPERVGEVLRMWEAPFSQARHCLIAGHNTQERAAFSLAIPDLQQRFGLCKVHGLATQLHADHTKHQAQWLAEQIQAKGIRSMRLYLPAYHLLRAWRTVIKQVVFTKGIRIPILPVPLTVSPFALIPEYQPEQSFSKWDMIPGELERIRRYETKGDIATYDETLQYIEWLWENL